MREQFHTKEGEEQKLVVSDTESSTEGCAEQNDEKTNKQANDSLKEQANEQPSEQSSAVTQKKQSSELSSENLYSWSPIPESQALKRHRLIVRSVACLLCVLSVAMGTCIYNDGEVNREIDKGLGLVADKQWVAALKVLTPIDKTKVSRRFSRDGYEKTALIMYPHDERFINLGRDLQAKGQLQEAETAYRTALGFHYKDFDTQMKKGYAVNAPPTPIVRLAGVLKEQHKTKEAIELLELAKAMYCVDYDTTKLAESLGVDIRTAMTEEWAKNREYIDQLRNAWIATRRLENEPSDTESYRQERRKLYESINKQIADFPEFVPAYLVRAEFNFMADPKAAMADLNHVLELYPGLPQALELRAKLYLQLGIQDQSKELLALQDYDAALKTLPNAESLLLAKSEALDRMLRYRESAATLDLALQLHPADVSIRERMARALIHSGDKDEALMQLEQASVFIDLKRQIGLIHREDREATIKIAALLFHLNKPKEALAMLNKEYLVKDQDAIELKKKIYDQSNKFELGID